MQSLQEMLDLDKLRRRGPSHRSKEKRERKEHHKQESAKKKWRLAGKLENNEMLVAALAFYCGRLAPGEATLSEPIHALYRKLPRRWRPYREASRRVLQIQYVDRETMRLPKNVWHCRLPLIGLKLHLHPEERESFENLNSDLVIDDAIRSFALSHPQLLERVQLFLQDGYRPSIPEIFGREEHPSQEEQAAARREEQKRAQWWLPASDERGPFAGHPGVDQPTRQELPRDPDDDDGDDPGDREIRYNSPRVRRITRQDELRAMEAEDRPENCYASRVRRRVIYRPGQDHLEESLPPPHHPYAAPATEEPHQGPVTPAELMRSSVRGHLARSASR